MQFDLERSIDGAALDVQSALTIAARKLPIEMTTPPSFQKVNPADQPVMFLTLASDTLPLSVVDEYAEVMIAQRISTLPGVAQVQVFGGQKFAVRVQADPEALASMGIGIDDLRSAVASANSNTPVGNLNGPAQNVTLQASGSLPKAEQYRPIIVAYRNGAPIRLGQVATVIDSVQNDKVASWYNGTRNVMLAILRQPDANTVQVVDSVKALVPIFQAAIPPALDLQIVNDRSLSIRQSIDDVQFTLILTVVLVVLVIFVFLRNVTATIIPALALPVSLIGTFAGMYVMGYSIDNLSLLAITLSVGFVVDDAIVMLENIVRHIEDGMRPMESALKGTAEIGFTILSITLSLVAVFIPVLFMGGIVGRLFREFAVTISMTIMISGIVSLTLTPMLRWRQITLAATFVSLGAAIYLFGAVPKGFFPIEDTGLIFAITEAAQDTSFAAIAERQKAVATIVKENPNVDVVNSSVGATGFSPALNQGRIFINLKPRDQRTQSAMEIIQDLREKVAVVPGMNTYFQPIQNIQVGGRLAKGQYQYTLQDADLDRNTLFSAFGTRQVSTIYTPSNDYQVILEADPRFQADPAALSHIYVRPHVGTGQGMLLIAAVLVIYSVLGILYESFIHPITILSGLPAAGLGALRTLMLFKQDLSVIAIIGIVMLIGIVKKNAIRMIDFAIERRKTPGTSADSAIYEACLLRFRPIMMTTMAAIMGTLPIALGVGAGSELRRPLGLAVVGGLLVSQTLTLYITPVVYVYMEKARALLGRKSERGTASGSPRLTDDEGVTAPGE